MPTDPATTAEEALVEAMVADYDERIGADERGLELARADYRNALAALSSVFIDVPCETCDGGKVGLHHCACGGTGTVSRRAVDVWVDATREQSDG